MYDLDEVLRRLQEEDASEDKTVYVRNTPQGEKVDYEITDRLALNGGSPSTTRELRSVGVLPCGHPVTAQNSFAGECQNKRWTLLLYRRLCREEYCARCAVQCPRCGKFVSAHCCARAFEGVLYCKPCRRVLILKKLVMFPFVVGGSELSDDALD